MLLCLSKQQLTILFPVPAKKEALNQYVKQQQQEADEEEDKKDM
jgi:hypothetical protein